MTKPALPQFFRISLSLLITICCIRFYEYYAVASKLFIEHPYKYELAGLFYDAWIWLIFSSLLLLLFLPLRAVNKRIAVVVLHVLNVLFLLCYVALIITFSERNTPFDHEFFTRSAHDTIVTTKQMMSSSWLIFAPFILYLLLYFILYVKIIRDVSLRRPMVIAAGAVALLSVCFIKYFNPSPSWFNNVSGYYLTSNKMSFWLQDSYRYLTKNHSGGDYKMNSAALEKEIKFYQQNQPFTFTSMEYPLLHEDKENDVLGPFFNLQSSPPNIVILVVEGLSRDFSGDNAYAHSFTPFLDSLSKQSLVWDNFLSTAPGTFAAHPAISGSLPYGKKGFSIMNVMPDHLSLIKILKRNGYFTNFMIGFNPDFDNMGGYIRQQGTDFILSHYPSKYKEMGVGEEGWSMGYPDDALYQRSFEVLDSLHPSPYLNIYHTATSHMPYLFEQKATYNKLFDKKMKTINVSPAIKRTLIETKKVLTTFMFADDCIKKFFADYTKRPDFKNTIFFITGDHHIGSFPSTGAIDDYHVPLIVYSPMLKKPQKFLSVNSHNNIAPTITSLLLKNYSLPYHPKEVHWLADVMDTATTFRNIQSMPFMAWSREISDYIYKDYLLSGEELYKLTPNLLQVPVDNDSIKKHLARLRENFKMINYYVCENNKVYPNKQVALPGEKELLKEFNDPSAKLIYSKSSDTSLTADFKVPEGYRYLYIEAEGKVNMPGAYVDEHPTLRFALIDNTANQRNYLYYTEREIVTLSKNEFVPKQWNNISLNDMFTLDDYKKVKDLIFETAIYTDSIPINLKLQQLHVKIYGVKK
jgi:lipoteichoic acid synthase